jgi:hypothetical protein
MQLGTDRLDACARAGMKNLNAPAVKREAEEDWEGVFFGR